MSGESGDSGLLDSDSIGALLAKGGILGLMLALVGGILYMAHNERIEAERHSKELIEKMIERCVPDYKSRPTTGAGGAKGAEGTSMHWDQTWRTHDLAEIEQELRALEQYQ